MVPGRIDQRAKANWDRANVSYGHYLRYLDGKPDRYALSLTDLVYVKNFKGGSSIVAEPEDSLTEKLRAYEGAVRNALVVPAFSRPLQELEERFYRQVKTQIIEFAKLAENPSTRISGFGVSFSSALLHFFFPHTVPILDRRALNGAGIAGAVVSTTGQVKNMLQLYPPLIDYCRQFLQKNPGLSIRTLDRLLFIQRIPDQKSSRRRK